MVRRQIAIGLFCLFAFGSEGVAASDSQSDAEQPVKACPSEHRVKDQTMTRPSLKRAEALRAIGVQDEIVYLLAPLKDPIITAFRDHWNKNCDLWIQDMDAGKVSAAALTSGMMQSLREGPSVFSRAIPPKDRHAFNIAYRAIVIATYPDFYEQDKRKLDAIIKRGKIRNDDEFYLVGFFFEQQQEFDPDSPESAALRRLMDDFEFGEG